MRIVNSFKYAFKGISFYFTSGGNVRIHLFATFLVLYMGYKFQLTNTEWMFLILAIALVHIAEAINTTIEHLVDFISPQQHPSAGKIKDLAAGAVLLSATAAAIIGLIIFIPYLCEKYC